MNSETFEIRCGACGQRNVISSQMTQKTFFYEPCSKCRFPIAYSNPSVTDYTSGRIQKYIAAGEQWAYEMIKRYQVLQNQKHNLEDRYRAVEAGQLPELEQKVASQETTIPGPQSSGQFAKLSHKDFEQQLADSRLIADMQYQLQEITKKLSFLESMQTTRSISQYTEDGKTEIETNITDSPKSENQAVEEPIHDEQSSDSEYIPEAEQLQAKKSQWLELYNSHVDRFMDLCETQLVGATKETLEANRLNRLSYKEKALFETGNGNYWLMLSAQRTVAFLMPNRKRIRFNQNVLDSVKVCFHLTHYSVEDLRFDPKQANFDQFRMLLPAVVDSVNGGLWRLRQKGVLLFSQRE